jgi:ubiquinone/menaquinone biosynthesis C-methylase UbiE
MNVREAYNIWADQYDTNQNKTRDLEAVSLRETLMPLNFDSCLEIGCGTGKNTNFLTTKTKQVTAIDFSEEMLVKARQKVQSDKVIFHQFDITTEWTFTNARFDLVTFSLVLEHIEDIGDIFRKVAMVSAPGGYVYVGELHPFRQYAGAKARFDTQKGEQIVNCYNHHVSDFTLAAENQGFEIVRIGEYFDNDDRATAPRILTILFRNAK